MPTTIKSTSTHFLALLVPKAAHGVRQEELNLAREKLKRKADAVARLEEELAAKQAALEQAGHASRSSAHAHERLQADFKDLQVCL